MPTYSAPSSGGTVRGSNQTDTITGSSAADVLLGLGGDDLINAGAGNDVIDGDGIYTVADALRTEGHAVLAYSGTVSGSSGLQLTSMGVSGTQSVWRIRNASNSDLTVVLKSASQGQGGAIETTIVVPAHSDYLTTSAKSGTHKLYLDDKLIDTKAAGTQVYSNTAAYGTQQEGGDTVNGGEGNDIIRGNGGNDILNGDAGNDTIDGGSGNDALGGGEGNDIIDGSTGNDTIRGGEGDDTLTGNYGTDKMYGDAGDDTFLAEWDEGNGDYYNGGEGTDTYKVDGTVVQGYALEIDLATGTSQYHDTFISVENLIGGRNNDKFYGDAGDNKFWGRDGNDILDGRAGNDSLYGENGNDTLTGGEGSDLLDGGAGDDILNGGAGEDTLNGGEGSDTASYSTSDAAVTVNLATGANSDGDTFVSIENVTGSAHDDTIIGNDQANILDGGAGKDTLDYSGSTTGVTVDLLAGKGTGGSAEGDIILNVEVVIGTSQGDTLTGNAADNTLVGNEGNDAIFGGDGVDTLNGGIGNDRLTGGGGADIINGGDGVDTLDFRKSASAVNVNLLTGVATGGDAEGDTVQGFENLSGSAHNDVLTGDNGANRITGMSGEDKIYGMGGNDYIATGGGYDYVDGGDGIDTVTYEDSWDRVVINLTTGKNQYGEASRDVLVNVENIVGSDFNDTITGDAGANRLTGGAGDDTLNGMAGIDYLYGGAGNDTMTGGSEADVFVFEAGFGNDTITDFWAGAGRTDRIWVKGVDVATMADTDWSMTETDAGVVISVDGHGSLTLTGVHIAQLQADDFIFG